MNPVEKEGSKVILVDSRRAVRERGWTGPVPVTPEEIARRRDSMLKNSLVVLGLAAAILSCSDRGPSKPSPLFLREFLLQSSVLVQEEGDVISSAEFTPTGWHEVTVPSTVLTGLVRNGVYPDPYVGMNNMRIPDAHEEFSRRFDLSKYSHLGADVNPWSAPYWYRTEFELPEPYEGEQIWLNFEGINYRADVWLNGNRVADSRQMVGMFEAFTFNISRYVRAGQTNVLAVKIHPLDAPGLPADPQLEVLGPFGPNGGPTADIGKNVTMQSSVGWDWIPAVRDRNMGIWQDVSVSATGPVDIRFPHVVTDLPLPETAPARLSVAVELLNTSRDSLQAVLQVRITPKDFEGGGLSLTTAVELPPGETTTVRLTPDSVPELVFERPRLWWPNTYGDANLYDLTLSVHIDAKLSDVETVSFGIREVGSEVTRANDWARRDFYVNGRRIQIKGGAWVPDMMLNRDAQRYRDELRLSKEANFNMVRIWGGGITPPKEFFDACDELGLLVWHDFWITGDCQGTFGKGTRDWPLEGDVFLSNARNAVKRIRNHPSLLVWTAGNEGFPRKQLYQVLRNELAAGLDGTRPFLPTSGYANPDRSWGLSWPDDQESGAYSGGPYHWVEPEHYYRLVERGRDWLFKDEVGIPSVPPLASLQKFIPDLEPDPDKPFPLNNVWGYHDAAEGNGKYSVYDAAIRKRYGSPTSLQDYVSKAQFVNAENYRAIFEAVNHDLDRTAGVILWKTNPAWPSVIWQVYDWYLRPNAGYYYAAKACEPLHVQLNLDDHYVTVVNTEYVDRTALTVEARVFDERLTPLRSLKRSAVIGPAQSVRVFELEIPGDESGAVRFVKLILRDEAESILSDNFYWLSPRNEFGMLNDLPEVDLAALASLQQTESEYEALVRFENPSETLAFFVNPSIRSGAGGEEVLPTFWSDNYLCLLPGESCTVRAVFDKSRLNGEMPSLLIEGWNIRKKEVAFR